MRAVVLNAPRDVRVVDVAKPTLQEPTDAVIQVVAACVCGSDLWGYRGIQPVTEPTRMGHEYVGVVEEVGEAVTTVAPGDFVVGSFWFTDNTCEICQAGYQGSCIHREGVSMAQSEYLRVGQADGTLVRTPAVPTEEQLPSLLAASDVFGTGWYAAQAAGAAPGRTIAIVGDGAVGLCAVTAARQMGAERVIAMSRHEDRAALAREFGADEVVAERGEEGIARIKELTGGYGAHGVVEAVGNQTSMDQAIGACRPGGKVGFVGVAHDVALDGLRMFFAQVALEGGPAPVREYLPHLIELIWNGEVNPGKVFTRQLPLEEAAEAYAAMDERRDIKVMLRP